MCWRNYVDVELDGNHQFSEHYGATVQVEIQAGRLVVQ